MDSPVKPEGDGVGEVPARSPAWGLGGRVRRIAASLGNEPGRSSRNRFGHAVFPLRARLEAEDVPEWDTAFSH